MHLILNNLKLLIVKKYQIIYFLINNVIRFFQNCDINPGKQFFFYSVLCGERIIRNIQ